MSSHLKQSRRFSFLLLVLLILLPLHAVSAQDESTSDYPVYVVQKGDTLYVIALRFGVSTDEIIRLNQISDPNLVSEGTQLKIPGLEGVSGVLTTTIVPLGQNRTNLVRQYQMPDPLFIKLNRLTSPTELYAGSSVIIPQSDTQPGIIAAGSLSAGESMLEMAAGDNANPWTAILLNGMDNPELAIPGELLYRSRTEGEVSSSAFSPLIDNIEISPLPAIQGGTAEVLVKTDQQLTINGSLNGRKLHFFAVDDGYVALQGVHALADPGPVPFILSVESADGETYSFEQNILLVAGNYAYDTRLIVDPATVDKANTTPEDEMVRQVVEKVTPEKLWDGVFKPPVGVPNGYSMFPDCTTDRFGNRRAYNDGPFEYFHTGIDLSACENTLNIYAPAAGVVVFADLLTVRGNYTVIDHGWGVYSAYGHQSEIKVKVGDRVEPGQLIGLIGNTGRVTGPHLHWEIWVNGVLVQPLDWINRSYP